MIFDEIYPYPPEIIIDCTADLHGHYPTLEGGDLLIVAGDLTTRDQPDEYIKFACWLANQKYKHKIFIGGNHDNHIKKFPPTKYPGCDYLVDSGVEFRGLKIWGSPWTKKFPGQNPHAMAFTCNTEEELDEKWKLIPDDTDILITHGPPYGIYDSVRRHPNSIPENTGSKYLWNKFISNPCLKLHVFGHIHEHGGKSGTLIMTTYVNSSHVNEHYEPVNKPIRIIL